MRIVLADVSTAMCDAFETHCGDLPEVEIHRGSILDCDTDALVSPANSFGFMNGGIDALYTKHFGPQVQRRLQKKIADPEIWDGELPVGCAESVWTLTDEEEAVIMRGDVNKPNFTTRPLRLLIAAPTMRVPTTLPPNTISPYLAARAALLYMKRAKYTFSVAMPGLGTGIGDVDPIICARQVRKAIEKVVLGMWPFPTNLSQGYDVPIKGDKP